MAYQVEVTDTFGGEANYCWVNRYPITDRPKGWSDLALVREAKRLAGWSGLRCRTENYGDMIELRPFGMCQVMFIMWED
jgi:hypothetical protein